MAASADADVRHDLDEVWGDWNDLVNMTPKQLEDWLDTDESKSVGQKSGGGESTGHESGRRIVAIKHKKKADLDGDDVHQMKRTVAYIKRHLTQGGPDDEAERETSPWRYSLMNWGHDPLK